MSGGLVHEARQPKTCEHYTPPHIFDWMGLEFDLDPCHPVGPPLPWLPVANYYTTEDDGLIQPWFGLVWMNPPYGDNTDAWMRKLAHYGNGMALVFARTDPDWFHDWVSTSAGILLLKKRIAFVDRECRPVMHTSKTTGKVSKGSPGSGSMLVAWGAEAFATIDRMEDAGHGLVWEPRRRRILGTVPPKGVIASA